MSKYKVASTYKNVKIRVLLGFLISTISITAISADLHYVTPSFVKSVTTPYEKYNDINPNWSNSGETISYERFDSLSHEIVLVDSNGKRIKLVNTNISDDSDLAMLLPDISQSHYFAFNISWSADSERYVFVSNGKTNNFDLYLGSTTNKNVTRLTNHEAIDNQASWSPNAEQLVFVSSRQGRANLHIYDLNSKVIRSLTDLNSDALNPIWSPDGKKIAFMQGEGNIYQIFIIDDINNPKNSLRQITNLPNYNNIRPSWSPDGSKIAFFTLDLQQSQQHWQIAVINSTSQSMITQDRLEQFIVSNQVIQNSLSGPSWLPDNTHIAYVQYIDDHYNPIHLVNINNKKQGLVLTKTKMNRDVSCSANGTLAFQSQDEQWSRIFIAKLPGFKS